MPSHPAKPLVPIVIRRVTDTHTETGRDRPTVRCCLLTASPQSHAEASVCPRPNAVSKPSQIPSPCQNNGPVLGGKDNAIQALARHSSLQQTQKYIEVSPDAMKRVVG